MDTVDSIERVPTASRWRAQYVALTKKHFILASRNPKSTFAQICVGVLVCSLLALFQYQANTILSVESLHEPEIPVGLIPRCWNGKVSVRPSADGMRYENGCTTLMYAPDSALTRSLMSSVGQKSGLVMGSDILPVPGITTEAEWPTLDPIWVNITQFSGQDSGVCSTSVGFCDTPEGLLSGECLPCLVAMDNRTVTEWQLTYPNSTQNVIWVFGAYAGDTSLSISYNVSATQSPFFLDSHTAEVKLALDQAFLESAVKAAHPGPNPPPVTLSVAIKSFPKPKNRISGFDIFANSGPQWMFVVPSVIFFHILTELVAEKESKLRVSMKQMGLRRGAYWAAWATYALVASAVSTIVLTICGHLAGFAWFTNTHPAVPLILFFLFAIAMVGVATLASALVSTAKTAQTVAFTIAIVGFVFTAIISSGYGGLLDLMYSTEVFPWVVKVRAVIQLLPPYQLARAFSDIAALSSSEIDFSTQTVVAGPGFKWSDLTSGQTKLFFGFTCYIPAPVMAWYWLLADALIFFFLGVYFDAVLPGPQGSPAHPLFFLGCTYRLRIDDGVGDANVSNGTEQEGVGVDEERQASSSIDAGYAVRVHRLRVVYRKGWSAMVFALTGVDIRPWCGRCTKSDSDDHNDGSGDVLAVKDMSLVVRQHEIFALLGHNGAGKTTTISVLTGLITATSGAAEVAGHDVSTAVGLEDAQNSMGVCPQHDLLWPQLNARETLSLFCAVKGVVQRAQAGEIERVLRLVALVDVSLRAVGGFSGGMKRRLSVAIAALGKPRVLMLDEPTTGMDPVHKQEVWRLMEGLRATSAVILTTHSMEEAGTLADRVAIMAAGRMCAVETPMRLKAAYGDGYRLSMVMKDSTASTLAAVRDAVTSLMPDARLALNDASSVAFSIPFVQAATPSMPKLLEWCDANSAAGLRAEGTLVPASMHPLLEDYGVSGPDLETVFVKVSAAAHFGLAEAALDVNREEAEHFTDESADEGGGGYTALQSSSAVEATSHKTRAPRSRSLAALCAKNVTLLARQRGLCLCQILTPLVVLALLMTLKYIIQTEAGDASVFLVPSITVPLNLDSLSGLGADRRNNIAYPVNLSDVKPFEVMRECVWLAPGSRLVPAHQAEEVRSRMSTKAAAVSGARRLGDDDDDDDVQAHKTNPANIPDCVLFFLYAVESQNASDLAASVGRFDRVHLPAPPTGEEPPSPRNVSNATGLLSHIPSGWCKLSNGTLIPAPYWDNRVDITAADSGTDIPSSLDIEFDADLNILNNVKLQNLLVQSPCWANASFVPWDAAKEASDCPAYILPDGAVVFRDLAADGTVGGRGYLLEYLVQTNDVTVNSNYHRPNNFSRASIHGPHGSVSTPLTLDPARLGLIDALARAFIPWANLTDAAATAVLRPPTLIAVSTMPALQKVNLLQIPEIVGGVLHTVVLTLPLPLFVFLPVLEKADKLLDLQRAMGMRMAPYLLVNYGLNLGIYGAVATVYWVASAAFQFTFFRQTSSVVLLAVFLGYGMALVSISNLLAAFLWSRQAAVILGFTVALLGPLMATAIAAGIYGAALPISLSGGMPVWYYAVPVLGPIFAVTRALYLGTYNCLARVQCFQDVSATFAIGTEMHNTTASLYISAVVYFILALYLDAVLPRTYGVAKHPLFFIPQAWRDACWYTITGRKPAALAMSEETIGSVTPAINDATMTAGDGSLFSYVHRWASAAGLSLPSALSAFARGEDSDVYAGRQVIENSLWPAAQRAKQARQEGTEPQEKDAELVLKYPVLVRALRKEFAVPVSRSDVEAAASRALSKPRAGGDEGAMPLLSAEGGESTAMVGASGMQLASDADLIPTAPTYHETEQLVLGQVGVKVAVSDVTLAVPAGSCFGLLGENGAGKTTTINMLQGLFAPTSGSALVCGYDIATETDLVRLSLGICPQHDIYWPNLTVAEHLYYYARLKGTPRSAEKAAVDAAATSVGLLGFVNRAAADLSGGMRRRLSLACALIGDPGVVLLDEPSTGLDPASRKQFLRLIDAARRRGASGRAFILISHDLVEVETLASSVTVMTYGRVRCAGTPQHLKTRYGGGYVLHATYEVASSAGAPGTGQDQGKKAEQFLLTLFPHARVESRYIGSLTLTLPMRDAGGIRLSLARAFQVLQSRAAGGGITEWSLTQPSLEAAFTRIVKHFRVGNEQEAGTDEAQ